MSTSCRMWAVKADAPPDVVYHDCFISPFCVAHYGLGDDYEYDFITHVRYSIQDCWPHEEMYAYARGLSPALTLDDVTRIEARIRQPRVPDYEGDDTPTPPVDEDELARVLAWLREYVGYRLLFDVR